MQINNNVNSSGNTAYSKSRNTSGSAEPTEDYRKLLEEKINEMCVKIQNGDIEESYRIGARSYTQKEWDQFLERFDTTEETVRELMREEQAKRQEEQIQERLAASDAQSAARRDF